MSKRNNLRTLKVLKAALHAGVSYLTIGIMTMQPLYAAGALPTGANVVAGDVAISSTGTGMDVTQTSAAGIVNWSSFSIGEGNAVQFNNGTGATLNRVTGDTISSIDGTLSATGSVYLINQNGIIVGSNGVINVGGGFVASTLDVLDSDFLNGGDTTFAGSSKAAVVNYGKIGALGGDVALIAAKVDNEGSIDAQAGTAALVAGYEVLMRDASVADGKFVVKVGGTDTEARNSGGIKAADAELRAVDGNVYALAGNTGSYINATGVSSSDGRVFLTAEGGTVSVDGAVSARKADGTGGTIVATGNAVEVGATAKINADGTAGGTILLGGDQYGGQDASRKLVGFDVANASQLTVASGAEISANGSSFAGGNVVLWSNDFTDYQGAISTLGAGGLGGFAEVSSKGALNFLGTAETGETGMLLLDPYNLTIVSGTGGSTTAGSNNSTLGASTLQGLLATNNVTVSTGTNGSQSGDITVGAQVSWTSTKSLTLDAYGDIAINAPIIASNAALYLKANGTITDGSTYTSGYPGHPGSTVYGSVQTASLDIQNHSTGGAVDVTLDSSSNSVSTLTAGSSSDRIGNIAFTNYGSLTVGSNGIYSTGNVSLTASSYGTSDIVQTGVIDTSGSNKTVSLAADHSVFVNNTINATGGTSGKVYLEADASITDGASGDINADLLDVQNYYWGAVDVTLDSGLHNIGSVTGGGSNGYARLGDFTLKTNGALAVGSAGLFSSGIVDIYSSGDLTITGDVKSWATGSNHNEVTAVTLGTGGNFINNSGSDAIGLQGSWTRWLVYAADSVGNTYGGLNSGNTAVWGVSYENAVSASGNRYVFGVDTASASGLSVTLNSISKTYGDTLSLTSSYIASASVTTSGHSAVTNAYLGGQWKHHEPDLWSDRHHRTRFVGHGRVRQCRQL